MRRLHPMVMHAASTVSCEPGLPHAQVLDLSTSIVGSAGHWLAVVWLHVSSIWVVLEWPCLCATVGARRKP